MKRTFRVTFKYMDFGRFRAVNDPRGIMINWSNCTTISNCAIAQFLQKNIPFVEDIKSAKVTIEFD